jgi:hypothetical protein
MASYDVADPTGRWGLTPSAFLNEPEPHAGGHIAAADGEPVMWWNTTRGSH